MQTPTSASKRTPSKEHYKATLANSMLGGQSKGPAKILTLQSDAPKPPEGYLNAQRVLYTQNKISDFKSKKVTTRYIPQAPEKILDAPELMDDYYLNLLDWSSTNILAVALGQTVYLWNASTGNIEELCTTPGEDDYVTSVAWVQEGNYIGVGTNHNEVQIWDVGAMRQLRNMKGHRGRVSSLAWNKHTLSSGSRDSSIINHDVRIAQHVTARLEGAHSSMMHSSMISKSMMAASKSIDKARPSAAASPRPSPPAPPPAPTSLKRSCLGLTHSTSARHRRRRTRERQRRRMRGCPRCHSPRCCRSRSSSRCCCCCRR